MSTLWARWTMTEGGPWKDLPRSSDIAQRQRSTALLDGFISPASECLFHEVLGEPRKRSSRQWRLPSDHRHLWRSRKTSFDQSEFAQTRPKRSVKQTQKYATPCWSIAPTSGAAIRTDRWPDHVRLSELQELFVCSGLRHQGRRSQAGLQLA